MALPSSVNGRLILMALQSSIFPHPFSIVLLSRKLLMVVQPYPAETERMIYARLFPFNKLLTLSIRALTCTLCAISRITRWARSTCVSTNIGWRRKINAPNTCVTRLSIHLAGVNVTITEPSCVASLTCASHVNKLDVTVDGVSLFWLHALTTVIACAHVNGRTPGCARAFVVSRNK